MIDIIWIFIIIWIASFFGEAINEDQRIVIKNHIVFDLVYLIIIGGPILWVLSIYRLRKNQNFYYFDSYTGNCELEDDCNG